MGLNSAFKRVKDYLVMEMKLAASFWTFIGLCILIYFYSKTNEMHQFFKFILFCSSTVHVSDGLFVHHQESKTVHTASGIYTVLDSWWWTERSSETCRVLLENKIKLKKLVHLVDFTMEIGCVCLFLSFLYIPQWRDCNVVHLWFCQCCRCRLKPTEIRSIVYWDKHVTEGKIEGAERGGRRRKQVLDELKKTRRCWKLKKKAPNSLWKRLWTCCWQTDNVIMIMIIMI